MRQFGRIISAIKRKRYHNKLHTPTVPDFVSRCDAYFHVVPCNFQSHRRSRYSLRVFENGEWVCIGHLFASIRDFA